MRNAANRAKVGLTGGADPLAARDGDGTASTQPVARILVVDDQLSMTDPLTGIYNRRYLLRHLGRELKRAQRFGGDVSLLLLDIDHFKQVNDTYGHAVGDHVLKNLTRVVGKCLQRTTDWCARLGGEEFAVVLEGTTLKEASVCAEKIRNAVVNSSIDNTAGRILITVSIGVSALGEIADGSAATVQTLLERADNALYASKSGGRNRVTLSSSQAMALAA
jgi:two-component system, cell cycle response regulator